jgi:hypothetical protein
LVPLIDSYDGVPARQISAIVRITAVMARRRSHQVGGKKGQGRTLGRKRAEIDEARLTAAKEKERAAAAEVERLRVLRRERVSSLDGLSSEALLEQIRIFKIVDKVDVRLSGSSSKLARLMTLADLIESAFGEASRDRSASQLEEMAGRRPKRVGSDKGGAKGRSKKKQQQQTWSVDEIVGARTSDAGVREYLIRWTLEDPEAPGEPWETWEKCAGKDRTALARNQMRDAQSRL